jgi:hypothetical protein
MQRTLCSSFALVSVMAAAVDAKVRSSTTPAARKSELSALLEACRAAALAAHSAAGLATSARERQVARLLRSAEALARAAAAAVPRPPGKVTPAQADAPARAASGQRSTAAPGPGHPAASDATFTRPGRRRRKKNNKDDKTEHMKVDVGGDSVVALGAGDAPASGSAGALAAARPPRVLAKKSSRERSPRRAVQALGDPQRDQIVLVDGAAAPAATPVASPSFVSKQAVVIGELASRPDLSGCRAEVVSYDEPSGRYAVRLESTDEAIRVKGCNLRPSIFSVGALASP